MKLIYESEKLAKRKEDISSLSSDQIDVLKEEEATFKRVLYKHADEIILSIYDERQKIHRKEVKLLEQKILVTKKRAKLLSLIGREAYNRRVKVTLPNRRFEI